MGNRIHIFPKSPTPYDEVNSVLRRLFSSVDRILALQLVGMYLYGSLVEGEFHPGRSDIDVVIATRDILLDDPINDLREMHADLARADQKWARKLEVSYLPCSLLGDFHLHHLPVPMLNEGKFILGQPGPEWILQLQTLRKDRAVLVGPNLREVIHPISGDGIRSAVRLLLNTWWKPMLSASDRLHEPGYQSYAVLSMCRASYALKHGEVVSKNAAARWAVRNLPGRWEALIRRALEWREGDPGGNVDLTKALIRWVVIVDSWQTR